MSHPRCVIVSSAALAKYMRWDAEFFLGDGPRRAEETRKAEETLERATRRLSQCRREEVEESSRVAGMLASGEVVPFPPEETAYGGKEENQG